MRVAVSLVVLCGCRQLLGLDDPELAADAGADARMLYDASDAGAKLCFARDDLALAGCVEPPTSPLAMTSSTTFDTSGALCATESPDVCIVAATSITLGAAAQIRITGSRPLVLLTSGAIELDGTLDVSSHAADGSIGPGAAAALAMCTAGDGVIEGGGGGGSFGTVGGRGGRGVPNQATGGVAGVTSTPAFHAGCPGGTNGAGTKTYGGGAIAIISKTSITFAPTTIVMANGAGGAGGTVAHGGFGGGAGGSIVLDAPVITGANGAQVFANGGGGGGGGGAMNTNGNDGGEATRYNAGGAFGAQAGTNAGDGGTGYPSPFLAGGDAQGIANPGPGGGGGGGGGGFVIAYTQSDLATVSFSPAVTSKMY